MNSSLGQTAIGRAATASGVYTIGEGYWYGLSKTGWQLYLPVAMKG